MQMVNLIGRIRLTPAHRRLKSQPNRFLERLELKALVRSVDDLVPRHRASCTHRDCHGFIRGKDLVSIFPWVLFRAFVM